MHNYQPALKLSQGGRLIGSNKAISVGSPPLVIPSRTSVPSEYSVKITVNLSPPRTSPPLHFGIVTDTLTRRTLVLYWQHPSPFVP